jgi:hypothetical protein
VKTLGRSLKGGFFEKIQKILFKKVMIYPRQKGTV